MTSDPGKLRVMFTDSHTYPIGIERDDLAQEPPDPIDPILTPDHVVFSPQLASCTEEAYHELRVKKTAENAAVLEARFPTHLFNPGV